MYLLTIKTRRGEEHVAYVDRDAAIARGTTFLGTHNEVDGCSTQPRIRDVAATWYGQRSSSFGSREAWVRDLSVVR